MNPGLRAALFAALALTTVSRADEPIDGQTDTLDRNLVQSTACALAKAREFPAAACNAPEHTAPPDVRASEPVRVFGLRMPFKVRPIDSPMQLTMQYSAGNSWNPTFGILYPGGSNISNPPSAETGTPVIGLPDGFKIYGADGVIRSGTIRFTGKPADKTEFDLALNFFMLARGDSPIDAPVGDRLVEWFHSTFRRADPFDRRLNGLNGKPYLYFQGANNKTYEVREGEVFLGTLDLGATHYVDLVRNDKVVLTLNFGAFAGIPLNQFKSGISGGVASGAAATAKITQGSSVTLAAGAQVQSEDLIRIREGVDFMDFDLTKSYRFLVAYNHDSDSGQRYSCGFELQGVSAVVDRSKVSGGPVEESSRTDIPVPVRGTFLERGYNYLARGSEYLTGFISYRFGGGGKAPTAYIYVQEDWKLLLKDGLHRPGHFSAGDNAQDVGVGVRVDVPFGSSRKR